MNKLSQVTVAAFAASFLLSACQPKTHEHSDGGHQDGLMNEGHEGHDMTQSTALPANANEASKAYATAMDKMHKDMAITYSNDADRDFLAGMIPHHQGAVDMARIVLEHGKDPNVRKLAQAVITAQEAEIKQMQAWLDQEPKPE
jgi:uncharacterized protein (DUF305 family)